MKKSTKIWISVLIVFIFLVFFYWNLYYFGVGFQNDLYDSMFEVLPVLLVGFIFIASILLIRERVYYGLILFLLSTFALFILFMHNFIWFHEEKVDEVIIGDNGVIDVYFYSGDAIYTFFYRDLTSSLFYRRKCVYWVRSPGSNGIEWEYYDGILFLSGMSVGIDGVSINLDNLMSFGSPCRCYNDYGADVNACVL